MNRLMAGAIGGFAATLPMTIVMLRLFNKLPPSQRYPLPPREITEVIVNRVDQAQRLGDHRLTYLSLGAHFAYGGATGALYPLLVRRSEHPLSGRPLYVGGIYGLAIWAASYLGWIPAAKILRPATDHPGRRNALMITAHWVWGASVALISEALSKRPTSARRSSASPREHL